MRAEAHRVGESLRKSLVRRHGANVEDVVGVKADDVVPLVLARGVEQRPPEITSPCGTPPLPRPFSSLKPPAFVPATPPYLATSSVSCKPGVFALNSSLETPRMTREGSRTMSSLPLAVPRVMAMSSTPSSAVPSALRGGGDADERGVDRFGLVVFGAL